MVTRELRSFERVISNIDEIPYCTGTVALDPAMSTFFYQSGDVGAASFNLSNITDEQLNALARACDPATFGLAQQDVLDESYRKAGKMDANRFATHFSPTDLGLLETISDLLLRGRVPEKSIRLELYKLNIYGPGGFFKAHVDTPRSDTMFASLVVVLPTVHEGGSLILRHDGKEWIFDSSKVVNTESTPHAAFISFFSDIEHEVTPVTSGYRVTLTYNLYLKNKNAPSAVVAEFAQTDNMIKDALGSLLKAPNFLPDGGLLGFGFIHRYPFSQVSTKLSDLESCLKGTDAAIKRACHSLSLTTTIKAVYRGESGSDETVLVDHFAEFGNQEIESRMGDYLRQYENGTVVYDFGDSRPKRHYRGGEDTDAVPIVWAKELSKTNPFSSSYLHYGNEASLACIYGEICLVATVPPTNDRVN